MEHARVGLFEDNDLAMHMLMQWLDVNHHKIVMAAGSLETSLKLINGAAPGSIDVALVDADLGKNHSEGKEVIKKLREKMGSIAIIGISFVEEEMEGADVNIPKSQIEEIVEYINRLN